MYHSISHNFSLSLRIGVDPEEYFIARRLLFHSSGDYQMFDLVLNVFK